MENTKVEVKINNMEYTIVSNESEEYVQRVALLVNKKISEVKASDKHLSTAMLAVMASMNLADELLKSEMALDSVRTELKNHLDESGKNSADLAAKKLEVENLKESLHKLEIELAKRETEIENLRGSAARNQNRASSQTSFSNNAYANRARTNTYSQTQNMNSYRQVQNDEYTE